eukprot:CAMPEP_0197825434 /NCGR_PEP_ID=MMETSP1437-20131217/2517_1 /TAXON_ID=49252 ORGANISM="Eucampia antarctica, Strain CCMP1452" /NCGR_SAMPLE_ID=MMETSP1437 /ASSEMBLY_ACC=CAM_ASM_001096 /LENGTH=330 /DNA_ID=CAMNT_0043425431 /DNA_START=130 /DNA_END=1122 /DNA_ORIENTATION=+
MASSSAKSTTTAFRRGLVTSPLGLVHYTSVGGGDAGGGAQTTKTNKNDFLPIIGFHMSPRSVDEYKEIMMECCGDNDNQSADGQGRLFVAMDEFGYGQSDNPSQTCTLDEISDCFLAVLDHLKIDKCIVTGSLMGCYMALSLASRYPDRIKGVVCTNLYYFQQKARKKALLEESDRLSSPTDPWRNAATPDTWELQDDGSHVNEIFGKRASWLSTELNTRATLDNLNYLVKRRERYANGVHIQDGGAFLLQETCAKVTCPVLCINGAAAVGFFDMIGMKMTEQFDEVLGFFPTRPETLVVEPPGSSINMMNENAKEWYARVSAFAKQIES